MSSVSFAIERDIKRSSLIVKETHGLVNLLDLSGEVVTFCKHRWTQKVMNIGWLQFKFKIS